VIDRETEISTDVVLASACLPLLHWAVEIDGEAYWDGAFSANPPLRRLALETSAEEIVLVQIMPEEEDKLPYSSSEITQRPQMITFNASLQRELQALEDLRANCNGATALLSSNCRKRRRLRLHRISAADSVDDLNSHSMMDTSTALLRRLHLAGCGAAFAWLARQETKQAA